MPKTEGCKRNGTVWIETLVDLTAFANLVFSLRSIYLSDAISPSLRSKGGTKSGWRAQHINIAEYPHQTLATKVTLRTLNLNQFSGGSFKSWHKSNDFFSLVWQLSSTLRTTTSRRKTDFPLFLEPSLTPLGWGSKWWVNNHYAEDLNDVQHCSW